MDDSVKKELKQNKCSMCQNLDKDTNQCKIHNVDIGKCETDFSKCNDYLINEKLVMF